jgi:hypothetical protein
MGAVAIENPETANLLGLILQSLIEGNLADPRKAARARKIRGTVLVQAGAMRVSLHCQEGRFTIARGHADGEAARARVRGNLEAFLEIALGGNMVGPVLRGEVKVGGNLLMLLKLLPLLQVGRQAKA